MNLAFILTLTPKTQHPSPPIFAKFSKKVTDLLVYFWPKKAQKWEKRGGFSIENLQILKEFPIFLGGDFSQLRMIKN